MVYIKITTMFNHTGIAKLTKYEGVKPTRVDEVRIYNALESIWYDEGGFTIHRYEKIEGFSSGMIRLHLGMYQDENRIPHRESLPKVEEITRKEYYSIINELKNHKIVDHIEQPKEPYMVDVVNSTNTCIRCVPKIGFEVGYKKVYTLEWFNSMGAAYPMPHLEPFMNNPYEIKVNTKKYKGYRFVPEESTTEKSVYQVVWPRKREFEKEGVVWR